MFPFNRLFAFALLSFTSIITLTHCGSGSSSSESGPTDISQLPKATGPVVGSSSIARQSIRGLATQKATTGTKLSQASNVNWTGNKSRVACENTAILAQAYGQASEAETIQCYMGKMKTMGFDLGTGDLYDGTNRFATLSGIAGGGRNNTLPKIKFNIAKDASTGAIKTFKMWMCMGGTTANPAQDGYTSQDLSNAAAATITSVYTGSHENGTYGSRVEVNGAVNSSGNWTSKVITLNQTSTNTGGGSSGTFNSSATITQYSDRVQVSGWQTGNMTGTYGGNDFTNNFSARFYSVIQGIGMELLSTLALGDGSSKYVISDSGTHNGNGFSHTATKIGSWTGDDMNGVAASSGDYYSSVSSQTPPSTGSVSISFNAANGETWDCALDSGADWKVLQKPSSLSEADMNAEFQKCETIGHSWINCYRENGAGESTDENAG